MTLTARPRSTPSAIRDLASQHMWWILAVATLSWSLNYLRSPVTSWHFFDAAGRAVLSTDDPHGGWHLYHFHPDFQFGPVTVVAAVPFTLLPLTAAKYVAAAVMSAFGLLLVRGIAALVPRAERWRVLMVGLLVLPAWTVLAVGVGHLDDVIALTTAVWAMAAIRRRNPVAAAVLLAVAADAKPWALAFAPLLLALTERRRRALTVWAAVLIVAWVPFVLVDPGSVAVTGFRLAVSPGSVLHLIDPQLAATPWWCRPVQLIGGGGLGVVLWRRHRMMGVVAVVVALRLATDPATWAYYAAGLLVGAALLDVASAARGPQLPWLSILCLIAVLGPATVTSGPLGEPPVRAVLRMACCAAVIAVAVFGRYRDLLRVPADEPVHPAPSPQWSL